LDLTAQEDSGLAWFLRQAAPYIFQFVSSVNPISLLLCRRIAPSLPLENFALQNKQMSCTNSVLVVAFTIKAPKVCLIVKFLFGYDLPHK
jgi:hypothetical protein